MAWKTFAGFEKVMGAGQQEVVLTSPEVKTPLPANEIVVSWNAETPPGTGLKVEARVWRGELPTKWYTLGLWSKDGMTYPRESVAGQKDADGDVQTDTLVLTEPTTKLQWRVTLSEAEGKPAPTLKFLGASLLDSRAMPTPQEPNRTAWGKEVTVPGRTQLGWPGASGWCSATSTDMTLAFWSGRLKRPELDMPVPDAAKAVYDRVWDGTGNWVFNTAFAGSFPGMRAYVTRFSDVSELEDWIVAGMPVVVSVSYDLLRGKAEDHDPGHLLVCVGFTKEGDIVLNDPAHHPEKGEACRRVFSRENFVRAWARSRDTVYLIYPEGVKLPADRWGHWE
ncbi:MAG TPA: C39 family peptidase [Chthonomonadaceae bacterium]|nr:C39 family peptidase [Chthonomonadaceae bacterium]